MIKWCFLPLGGEKVCREELISDIEFNESELILDMCCGTGGATSFILRKASSDSQIIGMDLSSGQLRQAATRPDLVNIQFIEGDVSNSCFRDSVFDKVFITHALHEMIRDTRIRVLQEAKRVIKENGSLIILELDKPKHIFCGYFMVFGFSIGYLLIQKHQQEKRCLNSASKMRLEKLVLEISLKERNFMELYKLFKQSNNCR